MKGSRFVFNLVALVALTLTASSFAQAQASRTFVSGVGDDINPCSRTAPCKTFAGAISKTADGGEIDVMDPGGFGGVTITRSVTIDGGGTFASILSSGNGVTVNDSDAVVTLRNLSINGNTTGSIGVRIVSAKSVTIEGCQIFKFRGTTGRAISDERTAAGGKLTVINTTINDNGANAVVILPGSGTSGVTAVFDNVRVFDNNTSGFFFGLGAKATIKNSFITTNGNAGIQAADANTKVNVVDTVISNNAIGVFGGGGASVTRLTRCTITENGTGVQTQTGGVVESFGDNNIRGNNAGNAGVSGVGQI
ncbi:MAG TPA: right-handed parallel beta-helix repeat-containing protein [Pyrinomonadaceae bacterium]|nr:right-handed parallel beta-helix repeat-containing protein [Pyrinomonadaceae bacterium]